MDFSYYGHAVMTMNSTINAFHNLAHHPHGGPAPDHAPPGESPAMGHPTHPMTPASINGTTPAAGVSTFSEATAATTTTTTNNGGQGTPQMKRKLSMPSISETKITLPEEASTPSNRRASLRDRRSLSPAIKLSGDVAFPFDDAPASEAVITVVQLENGQVSIPVAPTAPPPSHVKPAKSIPSGPLTMRSGKPKAMDFADNTKEGEKPKPAKRGSLTPGPQKSASMWKDEEPPDVTVHQAGFLAPRL
jgi:hypothetical protein